MILSIESFGVICRGLMVFNPIILEFPVLSKQSWSEQH